MSEPAEGHFAVPCYVIATAPFRTFVLDDADAYACELEQINQRTFDRLKLCRSTMALDVGFEHPAILTYTGALLYPRVQGLSAQALLDATNRLIMQLMFGGITLNAVSEADLGTGWIYDTGYFLAAGNSNSDASAFLTALQHGDVSGLEAIRLFRPPQSTAAEVRQAQLVGRQTVDRLQGLNPSIMLDGLTAFRQRRWAPALVFLWSTIEALLDRVWTDQIAPPIDAVENRQSFITGNAWQAAHKSELIFQKGLITAELYSQLNGVRGARNRLSHRGSTPDQRICEAAVRSAFTLSAAVVSDYQEPARFDPLAEAFLGAHRRPDVIAEPVAWRELPGVPGNREWGQQDFPRHPELELQRIDRG